jgi:hypothetical protein
MDKINTQLPEVQIQPPKQPDWFSRHHLWGYGFLVLSFLLAIALLYQMDYGKKPRENMICAQVVVSARNVQTGEVKEFPTPCDVPEGWEPITPVNYPIDESHEYKPIDAATVKIRFGIELALPEGWIFEYDQTNDSFAIVSPGQLQHKQEYLDAMKNPKGDCCPPYFDYQMYTTDVRLDFDQVIPEEKFTNNNGINFEHGIVYGLCCGSIYFTSHKGKHYNFEVINGSDEELRNMLMAMKFATSQETSKSRVFASSKYGFELIFPEKWIGMKTSEYLFSDIEGVFVEFKLQGASGPYSNGYSTVCYVSIFAESDWEEYYRDGLAEKPIYIKTNNGNVYGWGCGHDDEGYKGFEEYNKAILENRIDEINSGKIKGPYQEFKELIVPTFRLI